MDVPTSAALMVAWVVTVDPGSDPPVPGTSSPASPGPSRPALTPRGGIRAGHLQGARPHLGGRLPQLEPLHRSLALHDPSGIVDRRLHHYDGARPEHLHGSQTRELRLTLMPERQTSASELKTGSPVVKNRVKNLPR
jgi:hypothetical protein